MEVFKRQKMVERQMRGHDNNKQKIEFKRSKLMNSNQSTFLLSCQRGTFSFAQILFE